MGISGEVVVKGMPLRTSVISSPRPHVFYIVWVMCIGTAWMSDVAVKVWFTS